MARYYNYGDRPGVTYMKTCRPGKHYFQLNGLCFSCGLSRKSIIDRAVRELSFYEPSALAQEDGDGR